MDIVQLIVTAAGFIGLFVYQHYKIKSLKDQTNTQSELLGNIKTYFDIVNPEMLKYRLEQYEKLVEKEQQLKLKEIEKTFSKEIKTQVIAVSKARDDDVRMIYSLAKALMDAFILVPHPKRETIVKEMEDSVLKKQLQKSLPTFAQFDKDRMQALIEGLRGSPT